MNLIQTLIISTWSGDFCTIIDSFHFIYQLIIHLLHMIEKLVNVSKKGNDIEYDSKLIHWIKHLQYRFFHTHRLFPNELTLANDWRYLIPHHSNVTFWEYVKVSKSQKQILKFSFEPKTKGKYFCIFALPSKKR